MNVTIQDAINAFALLSEHVNENGFLHECYNLGISALKTIQDGNYKLHSIDVSRETLKEMALFNCNDFDCDKCIYCKKTEDNDFCMSIKAKNILCYEQDVKEVSQWIKEHS